MAEVREFKYTVSIEREKSELKTFCESCNTWFDYTLLEHVCPEKHGRLHRCMRCNLLFECKTEGCQAQFWAMPNIVVNRQIVEHCPQIPTWEWVRQHAVVYAEQLNFTEGLPEHAYGRCELRDGLAVSGESFEWFCSKPKGHAGACSCHNDCGAVGPEHSTCGMPPNHCGRHAWERA